MSVAAPRVSTSAITDSRTASSRAAAADSSAKVSSNPGLVTAHNGWAATAANAARVRANASPRSRGDPAGGVTAALDMYQT